jgi:predicted O-methyltransferase YrrM
MLRQARQLGKLRDSVADLSVLVETLWSSHFFRPMQKKSEILRLLEVVRALQPSSICEVGAAGGGTTFLLAHAAASDATVITIDLAFTKSRLTAAGSFASKTQNLFCLQEDSHDPETVGVVSKCLGEKRLDVLYLDGDHSYEGIKQDFELYSPLVRPGGLIVFHDIVPDYKTRYGIQTASDVGGVPRFWDEVKAYGTFNEEIVEDFSQDGFGIGVLHWNGE